VRLVEPEIGVVSNIGSAHLEFFRDLKGVAEEKGDILAGTAATGVCILPAEAPNAELLHRKAGSRRIVTFGDSEWADLLAEYQGMVGGQYVVQLTCLMRRQRDTLRWGIGGAHQALNAAAAASVGLAAGISLSESVAGLAACELPGMRMKVVEIDGIRWANDAYNANPTSMRAGLEWCRDLLASTPDAPHILVLGDMLELGPDGADAHRLLLEWTQAQFPRARILAVGPLMAAAAQACGLPSAIDSATAAELVREWATPGALVFLKGSRGIALERCLPNTDTTH
jgi:UDP-N-acetylmuramoyl-tripeptide--D-alanyl-D-alanine ligase